MNNIVLRNSGIQPEILARFKEIFPEHADIEEYLHRRATVSSTPTTRDDSLSIARRNNTGRLEQEQIDEDLTLSTVLALTSNSPPGKVSVSDSYLLSLFLNSESPWSDFGIGIYGFCVTMLTVSAPQISSSRNLSSQNGGDISEMAAAIALSLEELIAQSTTPVAGNEVTLFRISHP